MFKVLIACASLAIAGNADSRSLEVPTAPPYIVLSDNLDEPNGYGFCLDTSWRGKSDLVHAHTCKPTKTSAPRDYPGNDTRFIYNNETGRISSYAFDGFCVQALIAGEMTVFALLECSDHPRQRFTWVAADSTLRLEEDQSRCVTVAAATVPAGPWVKRPLRLEDCANADVSLKQWTIVPAEDPANID